LSRLAEQLERLVHDRLDLGSAASEALCAELKQTTDHAARTSWERPAALLRKGPDNVTS
jgi:hypothetical protein